MKRLLVILATVAVLCSIAVAVIQRQQNSTNYPVPIFMADAVDHATGKTGLTLTVTLSKNGGTFSAVAGAVSELGNGWYVLAGNATDRNTLGLFILHAEGTGADPADLSCEIVGWEPFTDPNATLIAAQGGSLVSANGSAVATGGSLRASEAETAALDASAQAALAKAAALDVPDLVLADPNHPILTDPNGYVTSTNGGDGNAPTVAQIVAGLYVDPNHKLDVEPNGWVTAANMLTAGQVDTQLTNSHGTGPWNASGGTSAEDWTDAEHRQFRDALGVNGNKTTAAGGQLQNIKARTDLIGHEATMEFLGAWRPTAR